MAKKSNHQKADRDRERLWPALAIGGLIFLLIIYFAAYTAPFFVGLPICFFAASAAAALLKWKPMEHITVTSLAFLAFVLMCGLASLYSAFQDFASEAFGKWFSMLLFFLIATLLFRKRQTRTLVISISFGIALTAVFSIDSASARGLTDFIIGSLMNIQTSGFSYWGDGRISGLFTNPNISGSMFALGIFLSLYVARTAKGWGEQLVGYSSLALSSLAFLLSFSMGSIGFFIVGVAVYLIAAGKRERSGLFLLMVETALSTLAFGVIATMGLGKAGMVTLIPDLVMILNAVVIWQLDLRVGKRLEGRLEQNGKTVSIIFAAVGAAAVLYVVLGFNLTGAMTLDPGQRVSRSAYPAAGGYSLTVEGPSDLQVKVNAQNSQQTAMQTSTTLYEGPASGAQFTVPEGTRVVYFELTSDQGGTVSTVTYSGASSGALKLKYLILPGFAATRIQGLWANQNVVQRTAFFADALKIWKMNPIIGKGMGAFEGYRPQVADFHYVTRYAHNVYFQTMAETGFVGIFLLLGMIACFVLAAIKGRRDEAHGAMAAPLLACLAMMWGHGTFEVIWSSKPYMLVAGLIMAAVQISFAEYLPLPALEKGAVRRGAAAIFGGTALVFGVLFLLSPIYAMKIERAKRGTYEEFMTTAMEGARFNPYETDFYRVTVLRSAFIKEDEGFLQIADGYAAELSDRNTYAYGVKAAEYYFKRGETGKALETLEKAALRGKADPGTWDEVVQLLMQNYTDTPKMQEGARSIYTLWKRVNAEQMDNLTFSSMEMAFLQNFAED